MCPRISVTNRHRSLDFRQYPAQPLNVFLPRRPFELFQPVPDIGEISAPVLQKNGFDVLEISRPAGNQLVDQEVFEGGEVDRSCADRNCTRALYGKLLEWSEGKDEIDAEPGPRIRAWQHHRLSCKGFGIHQWYQCHLPNGSEDIRQSVEICTKRDVDVFGQAGLAVQQYGLSPDDHIANVCGLEGARNPFKKTFEH